MKFAAVLLGVALAIASTSAILPAQFFSQEELDVHFERFKNDFGRFYPTPSEESFRKQVFSDHLAFIFRHNKETYQGEHTYIVGINNFTDMTSQEFVRQFNGYRPSAFASSLADSVHKDESVAALPATVDWTTKGVVTPIKNQGSCGSCWAFSTTGSIEGQHALKTGKLVSLSEQNLVDCSYAEGDLGCLGGLMDNAFKYVIKNKGLDTESSYPYSGTWFEACKFKKTTVGATVSSFVDVKANSESALQNAVATIGPISIAIDASQASFQLYKSGVYNEPACSSTKLDHGVLAVGYGTTQSGVAYWKVKNSWGTTWGEKGYILMSRNKNNQCGVATKASYPVV